MRLCGWVLGWRESDLEAESFELGDQVTGLVLRVVTALEVVVAQVVEALAGAEHVPDEVKEAVRDGHRGLVRPSAFSDLAVLGAEVASLRAGSRACGLDQGTP